MNIFLFLVVSFNNIVLRPINQSIIENWLNWRVDTVGCLRFWQMYSLNMLTLKWAHRDNFTVLRIETKPLVNIRVYHDQWRRVIQIYAVCWEDDEISILHFSNHPTFDVIKFTTGWHFASTIWFWLIFSSSRHAVNFTRDGLRRVKDRFDNAHCNGKRPRNHQGLDSSSGNSISGLHWAHRNRYSIAMKRSERFSIRLFRPRAVIRIQ